MVKDMLETCFLFQLRGPETAYLFCLKTPPSLIGKTNPRTGNPYGAEVRESLKGTRDLTEARRLRDLLLGDISERYRSGQASNRGLLAMPCSSHG